MADSSWQSRIVGSGTVDVDQILLNPKNWRVHPKAQQNAMVAILDKVGWVQQVVINQRTGNLIDGHMRVQLADRKGESVVPVIYVDLSPEEEDLVLATLDPVGDMAATDRNQLAELLTELERSDMEDPLAALLDELEPEASSPDGKPLVDIPVGGAADTIEQLVFYLSASEAADVRAALGKYKAKSESEALLAMARGA